MDDTANERMEGARNDELVEEPGLFDAVCAFCDNGGDILCCEGRCLRSFHATEDAGADTYCESLGYSAAQIEAIPNFLCDNCRYKQHQCFACGQLGSSDKTSRAEVFPCASATCGRFYHPNCVARLLFGRSELEATKIQKMIMGGESFTCPIHKCAVCNKRENLGVHELQFAICRRCPTSYHRKCLPRDVGFRDSEGIFQRAWEGLLPKRILIYCMKHKIDEILRTPIRNHIIFPKNPKQRNTLKIKLKRKISDDLPMEQPSVISCKLNRKNPTTIGKSDTQLKQSMASGSCKVPLKDKTKHLVKPVSTTLLETNSRGLFPPADTETIKRLKSLMTDVSSSLTLEDIIRRHSVPSTHASARHINKSITLGKVEGAVEAIRTALQKLEAGLSIDEAKEICEPRMIKQMTRWRKNLNVYLAPFLHGMRYTSFGRHFTKVDKLNEIVDRLQWYVQSGDTVVDFCCGANDFSTLMKEKLDAGGKSCFFKNYDIIQPKNDFEFERRDWMTVNPEELPDGSQLIIGLNPPFGVRAALANMFIDKALTFRPKLLILIVPVETRRLDIKSAEYDLIWEDTEKLRGKSFYFPGSIDVEENQIDDWNLKSPPLSLWSRRDWTVKHKEVAIEKGHVSETPAVIESNENDLSMEPRIGTLGAAKLRRRLNKRYTEQDLEVAADMSMTADAGLPGSTSQDLANNQSNFTTITPIGFAPGPLAAFSRQGLYGGWIDD